MRLISLYLWIEVLYALQHRRDTAASTVDLPFYTVASHGDLDPSTCDACKRFNASSKTLGDKQRRQLYFQTHIIVERRHHCVE